MKFNRDSIGRFATKVTHSIWQWTKLVVVLVVSIVLVGAVGAVIAKSNIEPEIVEVEKIVEVDRGAEKVQSVKNEIIYQLKQCESGAKKESDALIVFDTNKKPSLGLWQFQVGTVQHYYKTLYGKDITAKEAVTIALDEVKARELVADIMFKTNNAPQEWYNCSNKLDLKTKIELLKKL